MIQGRNDTNIWKNMKEQNMDNIGYNNNRIEYARHFQNAPM